MKRLIVNADDFGFARDVNDGILEAHLTGILTSTTIMATGGAFRHAVDIALAHPSLDVGVHLVLVGAPRYPDTPPRLAMAVARGRLNVFEEMDAQIRAVKAAGIRPTHLDTHKHTHLLPPVLDALARLAQAHSIPWVRRPLNVPLLTKKLIRYGCRVTDRFDGFRLTGKLDTAALVALLRGLPDGLTELMCHPGYCTEELRGLPTRLTDSRRIELEALRAAETREALAANEIVLTDFRAVT